MMGVAMEMGEGERLEAARRKRFWNTLGWTTLTAMPIGIGTGFVAGHDRTDLGAFWRAIPDSVAVAVVAVAVLSFSYGTWKLTEAIDEVELVDNLWGSTAAYYIYAVLFPSWWALAEAGVVSAPNHWIIFLAALAGGGVAYFWRKWRAH
jgi:hypothetical protein